MLNSQRPDSISTRDLLLTSTATNRTSLVHETHYNEDGYQFTVATGRTYETSWCAPGPSRFLCSRFIDVPLEQSCACGGLKPPVQADPVPTSTLPTQSRTRED
jgi:hypothetical protein